MGLFGGYFRFVVVFGAFLCLTSINSNYITINFTFICMKDDLSDGITNENGSLVSRYDYSTSEKSLIIWAVAAGTIVGTFPINWAYINYGARWPFLIAGLLSALSTALMPFAASVALPMVLVFRFIQGLAYSADFAAIGLVCVRWAPLAETGIFIAAMTSFTPISPAITNPVAGWLCTSGLGWKWAFYSHAAVCAVFFAAWILYYRDEPQNHPCVTEKELEKIQEGKTKAHIEGDSYVPYWEIIKNPTILVVWFNSFTEMTTVTLLLTYSPIYFHTVLGFDVRTTGLLATLTSILHMPLKFVSGYFSDKIHSIDERHKMIVCNSIAVGAAGLFCCLIGVVKLGGNGILGVICFGLVYIAMAANCGGFYKCGSLVSRQYGHFVLATIQFMKCVALVAAPASVFIFVTNESDSNQWAPVFYLNGALLILANFMFCYVCTDEPAEFTLLTRHNTKRETEKNGKSTENRLEMKRSETKSDGESREDV